MYVHAQMAISGENDQESLPFFTLLWHDALWSKTIRELFPHSLAPSAK